MKGKPVEWVPLAATAKAAGVSPKTMRRRMLALHHQRGGGVLRSYHEPGRKVRKWWLNPAVLRAALSERSGHEPDDTDVGLGIHLERIERLEVKLSALRNAHRMLKKELSQLVTQKKKKTIVDHQGPKK